MEQKLKNELIAEVFWAYTRSGAFQRAWIYNNSASDDDKKEFRANTKKFLFKNVYLRYAGKSINAKQLEKIIESLQQKHKGVKYINERGLKYGNAQKFVNLYLKAMWLTGYLKTPPHFPVDSIMIHELGFGFKWTNMDKPEYDEVIKRAETTSKIKKYKNTAEWEAEYYQREYIEKKKGE